MSVQTPPWGVATENRVGGGNFFLAALAFPSIGYFGRLLLSHWHALRWGTHATSTGCLRAVSDCRNHILCMMSTWSERLTFLPVCFATRSYDTTWPMCNGTICDGVKS